MMKYDDEKILALLNQVEQAQQNTDILAGPVQAEGQEYTFEQRSFFGDQLHLHVPSSFVPMSREMQRVKYPYEDRPAVILTNARGEVDITLQHVDQPLQDDWVQELTAGMKQMIKNMQPTNVFYEEKTESIDGKTIGYFDFKSPALDQPAYRLQFFLELGGETVIGGFTCPYKSYQEWRSLVIQMLHTIHTGSLKGE
ncbi:hypothetical protein [Paenibacillus sp. Z6-24]